MRSLPPPQAATEAEAEVAAAEEAAPAEAAEAAEEEEADEESSERVALSTLAEGDKLSGVVRSIKPYGAFVDCGAECDGLVHISEMSHKFVRDVNSIVQIGQKVDVHVLSAEPGSRRLSLSMKGAPYKATPGEKVQGRIVNVVDFGAFVNLAPGVDGLVHRSEVTSDPYADWESLIEVGKEVEVTVLEVDTKGNRISLSMRDDCDEYWEDVPVGDNADEAEQ